MLFDSHTSLEERIVQRLTHKPNSTANDILLHIEKQKAYSVQGLYKELRKLEANGVVVKSAQRYSLRIPWVLECLDFAEELRNNYTTHANEIVRMPEAGKKSIWHFTNLLQLNNFWSQVLVFALQKTQQSELFSYMPHPWYHLVYTDQERQYVQSLKRVGTTLYVINRGKTYLDTWAERFWKEPYIEYSFYPKAFGQVPQNTYINCIGDFVLTVKLSASITKDIEKLYTQTRGAEDINYAEIFQVFHQRANATMWLEKNLTKAKKIRSTFFRHFGLMPERG